MILKFTFFSFLLSVLGLQLYAQNENNKLNRENSDYSRFIISGTVSTQGIGADVKMMLKPTLGIRSGFSVLPFNWQVVYTGRTVATDMKLDADFANAHLLFDWHPLTDRTNILNQIVVTTGAAYWWKDKGTAIISHKGPYRYGDIVIPSNELGELIGTVQWNRWTPYLGFGLQNFLPSKTLNMGAALGFYYMGAPDATLTGTNLLANNYSNSEQFKKNMSFYRFLPVLQINLNINL